MDGRLTLSYDVEGDMLYIDVVPPYEGQESDELGDGVVARTNPDTGVVETLEILAFSRHFTRLGDRLVLPVAARLSAPVNRRREGQPRRPRAANE